jgi:hypothetical protein
MSSNVPMMEETKPGQNRSTVTCPDRFTQVYRWVNAFPQPSITCQ